MKDFVVYTAARLGIFAVCYLVLVGALVLVGMRDQLTSLWPLLLAAVISTVVSSYALRGMRDRFAAHVQGRADRMVRNSRTGDDPRR